MSRRSIQLVAGFGISAAVIWQPARSTAAPQPPSITVVVCNTVGAGAALLGRAQDVASKVYREAGITIVWRAAAAQDRGEGDPSAERGPSPRLYYVRLLPSSQAPPALAAAGALGFTRTVGRLASVVYPRVVELAKAEWVDAPTLLGYVMAHELGHLLLASGAHSVAGVMNEIVDRRRCDQEQLWFTRSEAAAIRSRLAAPVEVTAANARN